MIPIPKFRLEFILQTHDASEKALKSSLAEFGEGITVEDSMQGGEKGRGFKVILATEDPTAVFDICAQFGRIKTVKIGEGEGK